MKVPIWPLDQLLEIAVAEREGLADDLVLASRPYEGWEALENPKLKRLVQRTHEKDAKQAARKKAS